MLNPSQVSVDPCGIWTSDLSLSSWEWYHGTTEAVQNLVSILQESSINFDIQAWI